MARIILFISLIKYLLIKSEKYGGKKNLLKNLKRTYFFQFVLRILDISVEFRLDIFLKKKIYELWLFVKEIGFLSLNSEVFLVFLTCLLRFPTLISDFFLFFLRLYRSI